MNKKKYLTAMKHGDYIFALTLLGKEVETVEDPELYYNFAICCSRTGNHRKCIAVLRDLLQKFPRFIEKENIYRLLIWSHLSVKEYDQALVLAQERLDINPGDLKLLSFQSFAWEHLGQIEKAIQGHRKILQQNPNYINSLNAIAYLLTHNREATAEELSEASEAIKKALTLDRQNPAYLDTFGIVLEKSGKKDKAKMAFEKALASAPSESIILQHLEELL